MMAERLAELRRDLDAEAYTSYLPKTVRELLDHIANLEAQRGELARELDLTKREAWTAKERHKDEKGRADGLRERLDELNADEFVNAQRGGAVVVPTDHRFSVNCDTAQKGGNQAIYVNNDTMGVGYQIAGPDIDGHFKRKTWDLTPYMRPFLETIDIQPIPADRVLADGMVGVDREAIELAIQWYHAVQDLNPAFLDPEDVAAYERIKGIRSAKGEVEL